MHKHLFSTIKKIFQTNQTIKERDELRAELNYLRQGYNFAPPGHFYSPIPSFEDISHYKQRLLTTIPNNVPGVDFRESAQMDLLLIFENFYLDLPFTEEKNPSNRYYYNNSAYSYSDAIMLYCMIRHCKPSRIIEIGSGFSSCVILDTNELFFNSKIRCTFIEPYPALLKSLVKESDIIDTKIFQLPLQSINTNEFAQLGAGDILLVDSTHVSKLNSDVNKIIFEILPSLSPGVLIHFHDIFFPFEYPLDWLVEGRAWNEAYLLKAFLQYNSEFEIVLMNSFMQNFHRPFFEEKMPLCLRNTGGNIWIRRRT